MNDYSPVFENAHPKAKAIMKDPFYFNVIEETAPFGNDDGADTYAGFKDWRETHKNRSPKEFLDEQIAAWGYPTFDLKETNLDRLLAYLKQDQLSTRYMSGIDAAIISIAFGQIYLEGTIDSDFKSLALIAMKRELIPKILDVWGDYSKKRQEILQKMLLDLESVN
jgi:uncharacterized protein YfeS